MNRYNNIIFAAVITIWLASCENYEEYTSQNALHEDNVIKIEAEVNTPLKGGITTDNLYEFGLFIENPADDTYTYNNVNVTKNTEAISWSTSKKMFWSSASQEITAYAYSPYNQDATLTDTMDVSICKDQTVKDSIFTSDFLFSACQVTPSGNQITINSIYYDVTNSAIKIKLEHKFAKLIIKLDNTFSSYSIDTVYVNGTNTKASITFKGDGTTGDIDDLNEKSTIKAYKESDTQYECILIPQTIASGNLSVKILLTGEVLDTYIWESENDIILESGKSLNLILTKNE